MSSSKESNQQPILSPEFVSSYENKKAPFGFNGLGYIVYKRTYSRIKDNGENEEWHETIARCVNGAQKIGAKYTKEEAERLFDHIFNLRCNFAGRMLWQLGTSTVDRFGANSLLNCWMVAINEPKAFLFLFENLMLGGGVGYSIRREDVHELPRIKSGVSITHLQTKDADFIVPDSREGWVKLLAHVLDAFYVTGKSFTYSTILIRGEGEKINGFGGTASGPVILVDGIQKIIKIFQSREEKKLRSIDALDICNIIGSVVVAGNVRRSAEIALGDPDDYLYLRAKNWSVGNIPNWRSMSNNTIYADSYDYISEEIWNNGYTIDQKTGYAKGEPYGFFNLALSQKFGRTKDGLMKNSSLYPQAKDNCVGTNPCGEISLASYECCVSYDTPLITKNGIIKIGKASDEKLDVEIWNGAEWSIVKPHLTRCNQALYRVSFGDGSFIDVTADHRFSVKDRFGKSYSEVQTKDLLSHSKYILHTEPFLINHSCGEHISDAYTIGFTVGDGHNNTNNKTTAVILYGEKDFKCPVAGSRGKVSKYKRYSVESQYVNVTSFVDPLLISGLKNTSESFDTLFSWDRESILQFVAGLADSDGSNSSNGIRIYISDFNRASKIQLLLTKCGIRSSVNLCQEKGCKTNLGVRSRDLYYVQVTDCSDIPCSRLNVKNGRPAKCKGKNQTIVSVVKLAGRHNVYCFNEPIRHMGVFNNTLTYQCNLCELYLNNINSKEELVDCAKLLYKTQKAICAMPFLHSETNTIVHKNMRLGMGVTGICQSLDKVDWLDNCYTELRKFDKAWSKERGWPESIKLTTIKPSGTLSLLGGSTPGVHPAYSKYYIRRVRMSSGDKLVKFCRDSGYNVEFQKRFDGTNDESTVVVEFPCKSPDNTILAEDMGVIKQLEMVKKLQSIWSDNAVSVTAYYEISELEELKGWMKENYDHNIKSVSFLLKDKHGFMQAPYETIDEAKYNDLLSKINLSSYDSVHEVGVLSDIECSGGVCPVR